jgi:S-adenosylmethionine:tRNA ribosyltransferase-isomerase
MEEDLSLAPKPSSRFHKGIMPEALDFSLPPELEAAEPPEARGLKRDEVRLMVSNYASDRILHAHFHDLPDLLNEGDVVVINTSGTRNAALRARLGDGAELELHLSTHLDEGLWTVEPRSIHADGKSKHYEGSLQGLKVDLPGGGWAVLQEPYVSDCDPGGVPSPTLWVASMSLPVPVDEYLPKWGFPIRYNYVKERWPLSYYQTVYATETGSAEMPSAGRGFTNELLERLADKGIKVLPLILHTGVSNVDTHEPPYKEYYRVPAETAQGVSCARAEGRRVVAVGTTVVRGLESLADTRGNVHEGEGWTCLVVTPQRGLRAVTALLTGFHEPEATHLAILEALAGITHIQHAYAEALRNGYLWHEFGDLHLIIG